MSSKVLNFINANKKSTPNKSIKDVFTFGKHKGKTYQEVFDIDKPYICWILQADTKYYSRAQLYYTKILDGK